MVLDWLQSRLTEREALRLTERFLLWLRLNDERFALTGDSERRCDRDRLNERERDLEYDRLRRRLVSRSLLRSRLSLSVKRVE